MSANTFLIVHAIVNAQEQDALTYYTEHAMPLLVKAGGKPVGRYKVTEKIAGSGAPHMTLIMEFPDSESIKNTFDSEDYQALVPHREKAFSSIDIFIGEN